MLHNITTIFNGPVIFHYYMCHNLLSHSSLVEHLGHFQLLVATNNALKKSFVHFQTFVSHFQKLDNGLLCTG